MVQINKDTRTKLDVYINEIERLQPIHPTELPFKEINYYFLKLLVNNKEIIKKNMEKVTHYMFYPDMSI